MSTTTTAARLHRHGEPLIVESVELPPAVDGELTVELEYGGVNPIDRYVALGRVAPDTPLPRTLGGEAAGRLGDVPVLVTGSGLGAARDGVWSGTAHAPAASVIELPDEVGTREAAAMGVAGLTAWNCVHDKAAARAGDRALVLGASGGVGSMIVSLLHGLGVTVWGQTGSASKAEQIERLGADRVLVAGAPELEAAARELEPTVVFDPLGGPFLAPAVAIIAPRGRIVNFGTSASAEVSFNLQALYRKGVTLYGYGGLQLTPDERRAGLQGALGALAQGLLTVTIDEVLPLTGVNDAFARLEHRQVQGKLLLDLRG